MKLIAETVIQKMENINNTANVTFIFAPELWTGNMIISAILTILTLYIATSLIYHDVKFIQSKHKKFFQLSLEKQFAVSSKYICILIAVISVIRNANSLALLILERAAISSDINILQSYSVEIACKILPRIGTSATTIGTGLVYLFLWFRQRVFYVHPSIKVLNNSLVKTTSWGIILVWILYYIPTNLCYYFLVQYQLERNGGCLVVAHTAFVYFYIVISWLVVSVLMQIALLGLFIFPIIKRTLWRNEEANRNSILLQRVKKAIIITAVCLVSDILTAGITWSLTRMNATSFFSIYGINLVINHMATVACFDQWKLMLWPWKCNRKNNSSRLSKLALTHSAFQNQSSKLTTIKSLNNV